jgi:hypothetical protein
MPTHNEKLTPRTADRNLPTQMKPKKCSTCKEMMKVVVLRHDCPDKPSNHPAPGPNQPAPYEPKRLGVTAVCEYCASKRHVYQVWSFCPRCMIMLPVWR